MFHHVLINMEDLYLVLCTEYVSPRCWHFDNGATSKIDDVLSEYGGLLNELSLAVHLNFFRRTSRGDFSE